MSDELFGDDREAEDFEPDASTIAFLDQQQAEFEGMVDEFHDIYGFKHDCHCGEDYAAGRVGEITQCYHNMMQEALATCARLNAELKEMTGIAQALFAELKDRVQSEPSDAVDGGLPESEGADDGPSADPAADDAAGEGFGSARFESGETDES